jgi:hypothetical protein
MMKILLIFLLMFPRLLIADERTFDLGANYNFFRLRDKGMSPLLYDGPGFGISGFYTLLKRDQLHLLRANIFYGKIKHHQRYFGPLLNSRISLEYSYLRTFSEGENVSLKAGITNEFVTAFRYHPWFLNSAFNYDIFLTASPSFYAAKKVPAGAAVLNFDYQLYLPLLAFVIRPAYAMPLPDGLQTFDSEYQPAILRSINVMTINRFLRFQNRISASAPLGRNALRMSYEWGFYRIRTNNEVTVANHAFTITWTKILR